MKKAIIITGQTGTGKTARAIDEAKLVGGEILNADARQIYKSLTIVTGKDLSDNSYTNVSEVSLGDNRLADIGYYTIDGIRIWGYDLIAPSTFFSSFDYKIVANNILRNAISASSTPIIVGGTHLYIKHLTQNFDIDVAPNWELRKVLEGLSTNELQERLQQIDSSLFTSMNESDRLNPRRLMRKIEIATNTLSDQSFTKKPHIPSIAYAKKIGLAFSSPEACRTVIQRRIEERIKAGAINEIKEVLRRGYTEDDPGLQAIGYKELISYLKGTLTLEEAVNAWLTAEVQYAKRQLSFMKQDKAIEWSMV